MNSIKKGVALLTMTCMAVLAFMVLEGCWSRRELNTLAFVAGIGLDIAEETGRIRLTAQIIKPGEVMAPDPSGGGGGGGSKASAVWVVQSEGDTVFDAVRNFSTKSPRKLYFPHNQIIVFGKTAAEQGVRTFLDFFVRNQETRSTIWVLVADDKAADVLAAVSDLERIPAIGLANLIESRIATSEASGVLLHDFLSRIMSKTTAPVASHIEVFEENREKKARLVGTAVFKRDKMVGKLDKPETRGLLWVSGEVKGGIIVINALKGMEKACFEILRAKSKVTPALKAKTASVTIDVQVDCSLGEQSGEKNLATVPAISAMEKELNRAVEREIMAAVTKTRELNADIFGFGDEIHRKYRKEWKAMEPDWDTLFSKLHIMVKAKVRIRRTGLIIKPAVP